MSGICLSDWVNLHCGDRVTELEGRHVGRVEYIENSAFVWVKWLDNGWYSRLPLRDVMRVREVDYA